MISTIPIDKARNPLVDRHPRLEAEVAAGRLDIGVGLLHIARLHVGEFADCGLAAGLLDDVDEAQQRLGAVVADVVEPVRRGLVVPLRRAVESEEQQSELQSPQRNSSAVFWLTNTNKYHQ